MSWYYTYTSLRGPKETVVRILNAAIRNTGKGTVITAEDNLETINQKIMRDEKHCGIMVSFHDLLDESALADNRIQDKMSKFERENHGIAPQRAILICDVTESGNGYAVESSLGEEEYDPYIDSISWSDICAVYGCTVFSDLYDEGYVENYQYTDIYEPENGEVKTTHFDHKQDIYELYKCFYNLIELDPARYRPMKISELENLAKEIHEEINREKINIVKAGLSKNGGHAVIPEDVDAIVDGAFQACSELKSIELHKGIKLIGCYAFEKCENLTSIDIPEGVEIGTGAFKDCPCGPKDPAPEHTAEEDDEWLKEILG